MVLVPEGLEPGTPFSVGIVALAVYLPFVHAICDARPPTERSLYADSRVIQF